MTGMTTQSHGEFAVDLASRFADPAQRHLDAGALKDPAPAEPIALEFR